MKKEEVILNKGLEFAMEFGANWLKPIQERLAMKFPDLSEDELNNYNEACRAAMFGGQDFVYKTLEATAEKREKITGGELKARLKNFLAEKYPWTDPSNTDKLYSQAVYYAWKDGLHDCLV